MKLIFAKYIVAGGEDCVHYYTPTDPNGMWNDAPCERKNGAVCEKSPAAR